MSEGPASISADAMLENVSKAVTDMKVSGHMPSDMQIKTACRIGIANLLYLREIRDMLKKMQESSKG